MLDTGRLLFNRYKEEMIEKYSIHHTIILEAMEIMGYQAVNLAPDDIFPNINFAKDTCAANFFPVISANIEINDPILSKCIKKYTITSINNLVVGITGVMPTQSPDLKPDIGFKIIDPATALKPVLAELTKKTDFIILLSQLKEETTLNLANKISGIDLALCTNAYTASLPDKKEIFTAPYVMSIIPGGKEVGIIKIAKSNNDSIPRIIDIKKIVLDKNIESDEDIDSLISASLSEWEKIREAEKHAKTHEEQMEILGQSPEEFLKNYKRN